MPSPRIQVIIDALNMAEDDLKKLDREIEGLDKSSKKSSRGFGNLKASAVAATAAIAGIGFAGKKAFEFAERGAELQLTEERFDRLSKSIGTTATTLEDDLQIATRGMLSEMESMQLATDLMSLGLAKSHEEAVRLTNVASQLNMDMNQLVLTLTNQTTMRFDALGVAVDGFDEKVQKLEESGHDANEAFKLAFMQQAEEQIEKVGSAADSAAGEFQKFKANMKDVRDSAAQLALKGIEPLIRKINKLIDSQEEYNALADEGIKSSDGLNDAYKDYVRNLADAAVESGDLFRADADRLEQALLMNDALDEMNFYQKILIKDTDALTMEQFRAARAYEGSLTQLRDLTLSSQDYHEAGMEATEATETWGDAFNNTREMANLLGVELDKIQEKADAFSVPQNMAELLGAPRIGMEDLSPMERLRFRQQQGVVPQQAGAGGGGAGGQSLYTIQAGDTLSEVAEQFGTSVQGLMDINANIDDPGLIYAGQQLNIPLKNARQNLEGMNDEIDRMTSSTHNIDINVNVNGGSSDAITEAMMDRLRGFER